MPIGQFKSLNARGKFRFSKPPDRAARSCLPAPIGLEFVRRHRENVAQRRSVRNLTNTRSAPRTHCPESPRQLRSNGPGASGTSSRSGGDGVVCSLRPSRCASSARIAASSRLPPSPTTSCRIVATGTRSGLARSNRSARRATAASSTRSSCEAIATRSATTAGRPIRATRPTEGVFSDEA